MSQPPQVPRTTDPAAQTDGGAVGGKGLKQGALGYLSSTVIGVASTAPAYSLAATIGLVVAAVGTQAPLIMVLAFLPMFCIALAYQQLNHAEPDCGSVFRWAGRAFGPRAGWLGGWAMLAAFVIVMSSLAQVAGSYTFELLGAHGLAADTWWTTVVGVVWIAAMTAICYRGIELAARIQYVLLTLEIVILVVLAAVALLRVYTGHAPDGSLHPSLGWFDPTQVRSAGDLSEGVLLAAFIFWGWDTTVAVNEETVDANRVPGRAAVVSILVLLGIYAVVTTAVQAYAGIGTHGVGLGNPDHSADVLSALGRSVFGDGWLGWTLAKLLVLMVLTSAAAATQTTVLPAARVGLSMAVHQALPARYARVHQRFRTPHTATLAMGGISVAFYLVMTAVSTNVLADSVAALGLTIAFYYGLTGIACAWYFRGVLRRSAADLWLKGVLPLCGSAVLLLFFVKSCVDYAAPDAGWTSWSMPFPPHWRVGGIFLIGVGTLLLGVVLMALTARVRPAYFRGETIAAGPARGDVPVASGRE